MPAYQSVLALAGTIVSCVAASLLGLPYAEGRRSAIGEAFVSACAELRSLGHLPVASAGSPARERDLASWYRRAVESARSGWLSDAEASALREATVACGGSPEAASAWGSGREGTPRHPAATASALVGSMCGTLVALCAAAAGLPQVASLSPAVAAAASCVTASDLRYRTIPVAPSVVLAGAGVASWSVAGDLAATALLAGVVALAMWAVRIAARTASGAVPIGAGDVRLCLASLVCAGSGGAVALLLTMLASCVAVLVWGRATGKADRRTQIPLGPVLVAGAAIGMATSLLSMA